MYRIKHYRKESGQIIIVVAFLMIAMIAMLGLAIDGGGLMLLQRDVQNASDAAVVAATYAVCTGGADAQIINAAREAAKGQGFEHGIGGVTVNVDTNYTGSTTEVKYVQVVINSPKESYFIQIVYKDSLNVSAEGVGRCNTNLSSGGSSGDQYAIYAGSSTCKETQDWPGSNTNIYGDVHSNSDYGISGGNYQVFGEGTYRTKVDVGGGITWSPNINNPRQETIPRTDPLGFSRVDYAPGGAVWNATPASNRIAYGGCSLHSSDKMKMSFLEDNGFYNKNTKTLRDGLYYSPCGIEINDSDVTGNVTFVAGGIIDVSGSSQVLEAYIDGMLAFSDLQHPSGDQCSKEVIKISGSKSEWRGLLYGPNGMVEIPGSSNSSVSGGVIGNTVRLNGSNLEIRFDSSFWPVQQEPPTIGIAQ